DEQEPEPDVPVEEADIEQPLIPEWRVGPMALQYEEDRDRIVLVTSEQPEPLEDPEAEPDPDLEVATARFVATRAQMRAPAEHAATVVEAGRPRCRSCGNPMDASGHVCPAMNGHRES
ncbi:MAG: DUF3090 family protein, partial [Actinobacteria bacterium]